MIIKTKAKKFLTIEKKELKIILTSSSNGKTVTHKRFRQRRDSISLRLQSERWLHRFGKSIEDETGRNRGGSKKIRLAWKRWCWISYRNEMEFHCQTSRSSPPFGLQCR